MPCLWSVLRSPVCTHALSGLGSVMERQVTERMRGCGKAGEWVGGATSWSGGRCALE